MRQPEPIGRAGPSATYRWAGPLTLGVAFAGLIVLALAIATWAGTSVGWAQDFRAYYDASIRLLGTGTPYQAETLAGPFHPGPPGLYLYSPLPALFLAPLVEFGFENATLTWLALHLVAFPLTCALMPVSWNIRLVTLGVAGMSWPVLFDINLGNVSLFVTFLAVLVWRWLDRPIGSIALAISLAFRPTMALIGGWWLLRGRWRPAIWTIVATVTLVLASLPFVGVRGWLDYLTVLLNLSGLSGVLRNVDLGSAVLLFGGPPWAATVALVAGYVVAGLAVVASLRRDRELSFVVTLMATLLLSPLLWDHYLTHLIVPAAFLAARGRTWALALPLLGWLPLAFLPFVALAGLMLPFLARDRGEPAGFVLDLDPLRSLRPRTAAQG